MHNVAHLKEQLHNAADKVWIALILQHEQLLKLIVDEALRFQIIQQGLHLCIYLTHGACIATGCQCRRNPIVRQQQPGIAQIQANAMHRAA